MPIFREGNLFNETGLKLITANSFLTDDSKLVMVKGPELELRILSPGIDQLFGEIIHDTCGHLGVYGLILDTDFGLFQVRCDFRQEADIELIMFSTFLLTAEARTTGSIIHLNYPINGSGKSSIENIRPLLNILPENVHIWERKEASNGLHTGIESIGFGNFTENRLVAGTTYDRYHERDIYENSQPDGQGKDLRML